jgi:hypothetical protein
MVKANYLSPKVKKIWAKSLGFVAVTVAIFFFETGRKINYICNCVSKI